MGHHFIVEASIDPASPVILTGSKAHHAFRVLRLRVGDKVSVADGQGSGYWAQIAHISPEKVVLEIRDRRPSPEPRHQVILIQGWPKGDKLDLIIEKGTELGVHSIFVVQTQRSIPRPPLEAQGRRKERWQRKALAAAQQSRRHWVPRIEGPLSLLQALDLLPPHTFLLVPWEEERQRDLRQALSLWEFQPVGLFIGPEGGFSQEEIEIIREKGGLTVTLGPRILRTETASLACLSVIMYVLGEFSYWREE